MLRIDRRVAIADDEIELRPIRAGGPGGQHVDKAATAVHLRFDIRASSLPESYKRRLLALDDQRISGDGVIVIKAREHRSREHNEASARERLRELIAAVGRTPRPRRPTRPSRTAKARRVDDKKRRGRTKSLRRPPE